MADFSRFGGHTVCFPFLRGDPCSPPFAVPALLILEHSRCFLRVSSVSFIWVLFPHIRTCLLQRLAAEVSHSLERHGAASGVTGPGLFQTLRPARTFLSPQGETRGIQSLFLQGPRGKDGMFRVWPNAKVSAFLSGEAVRESREGQEVKCRLGWAAH